MPSKDFLKNLSIKLKTGNSRSIHLNSVPSRYATRLDISDLKILPAPNKNTNYNYALFNTYAEYFLSQLTEDSNFSSIISFSSQNEKNEEIKLKLNVVAKRLNSIHYENVDTYLEHGIKNFGFGYPLLLKRDKKDPTRIIKAPIFIWNLDIDKSNTNQNTWIIKREEDYPIYINQLLISYIKSDEGVDIKKVNNDFLTDSVLQFEEIYSICNDVLIQLNAKDSFFPEMRGLISIPSKDKIEILTKEKPVICWSGVFGLFRTQKESIIHDIDNIISDYDNYQFEKLTVEKYQTSTLSAVETDPSQEEILNTISTKSNKIIQGPPGTGKSQSLTSIITNALENKAKCLVVCEKKTALQVIFNNLDKLGLSSLCAMIDDVSKDRKRIIDLARKKIDRQYHSINFKNNEYESLVKSLYNTRIELNERQSKVNKRIFGDYTWKEIIGKNMSSKKKVKTDIDIGTFNLELSTVEYKELSIIVDFISHLFCKINDINHPLNLFNENIFNNKYTGDIKKNLISYIDTIYKSIKDLHLVLDNLIKNENEYLEDINILKSDSFKKSFYNKIVNSIPNEFNKLKSDFNEFLSILSNNVKTEYHLIESFHKQYPSENPDTDLLTSLKDKILSIFSKKKKNKIKLKDEIKKCIINILKIISKNDFYEINNIEKGNNTANIIKNLDFISKIMNKLANYTTLFDKIENLKIIRNNDKNKIISLYYNIISIHEQYNYFDVKFSDTHGTFNKEGIVNSVNNLQEIIIMIYKNTDSFRDYYEYKYYFNNIPIKFKNLIKSLINKHHNDIKNAFNDWYLNKVLSHYYNNLGDLITDDKIILDLINMENLLKNMQREKIIFEWETTQYTTVQNFKLSGRNIKALYNYRQNKEFGRKNSLRSIIDIDFQLFTDLFPVILINPNVCSSILPLKEGIFDVVIFDEASQLRIEDTYAALIRGKHKIISGDKHQMPPSNYFQADIVIESSDEIEDDFLVESESLLKFAEDSNYHQSFLDFHYRSRHPYLIDFSNNAFYGSRLMPTPSTKEYKPIRLFKVNSLYDSNVNVGEAEKILDIIKNEIEPYTDGSYPSVGIATTNITQRNLILDMLRNECYRDNNFIAKYEKLIESGLFVKNLENIQGDEKDIIIISTTFGLNKDGKFNQIFGPLNNKNKGYRLLNVIITRAKNKLYVCTSIPSEYYSKYKEEIEQFGNKGKGIFYAYIAYAESIENENISQRESIINLLKNNCPESSRKSEDGLFDSPFEEEVYDYITDYISKDDIIIQHKVGGYKIDFAIKIGKSKSPVIALECDGKSYHSSPEAYSWDMYRQKRLEEMGFIVYRIWSTNWWLDPQHEISKLLQFVEHQSKNY